MTTIVLVDDHRILRQGLKVLLEAHSTFQIVGEASDGLQAVTLVRQFHPDVLVLDINLPSLNGIEVIRCVKSEYPDVKAIMLTMHSSEDYVLSAFANGASAYVLKDSCAEDLVNAIHQALDGNRYLSPQLADRAIENYLRIGRGSAADPFETLTQRERQIIQLSAEGYSHAEIGDLLHISPRTAETHRANAMHKLGLMNAMDLVRYAIRRGLVSVA